MTVSRPITFRIDPTHAPLLSHALAKLRRHRDDLLKRMDPYPLEISFDTYRFVCSSEDELKAVIEWLEGELARVAGFSPRKFHARGIYR